jgi:hypothetical protein
MAEADRAARPSATVRRARDTAASMLASPFPVTSGASVRCTLSGRVASTVATRLCHMASAKCGTNGAMSRHSVVRTSYSVAYAARLSASSSPFQNRRRLRRTYQFESSSTNDSMARVPRIAS